MCDPRGMAGRGVVCDSIGGMCQIPLVYFAVPSSFSLVPPSTIKTMHLFSDLESPHGRNFQHNDIKHQNIGWNRVQGQYVNRAEGAWCVSVTCLTTLATDGYC